MRSSLYSGTVRHTRLRPKAHSFEYRAFYLLADIDLLDELDDRLRWFSHNRFNLFSLNDSDHGSDDGTTLRAWVEATVGGSGIDLGNGSVFLLAYPRVLGYVFNPISVWYCHDEDGVMKAVIYEVRNTFGDKHSYVVPVDDETSYRHDFEKRLHVSPFMDMEQTYHFSMSPPGERLTLGITQTDSEGVIFRAGVSGDHLPLTDSNLVKLFLRVPLVTLKTIAAIHFEALRIWFKGIGFRRRPAPPSSAVSHVRETVS